MAFHICSHFNKINSGLSGMPLLEVYIDCYNYSYSVQFKLRMSCSFFSSFFSIQLIHVFLVNKFIIFERFINWNSEDGLHISCVILSVV